MDKLLLDMQQIMRRRHLALAIVRVAALAMIVYGGVHMIWGLGVSFGSRNFDILGGFDRALTVYFDNMWNPTWVGFAVLAPGVVLALASRRTVRWIPLPRLECPQCGYALQQLTTPRCPECGIELGLPREPAQADSAR